MDIKLNISENDSAALGKYIASAERIVVTAHQNPDGDAMGSALGLVHILQSLGKNCVCVLPDRFPGFYKWMPGSDSILFYEENKTEGKNLLINASLIFCLDYNAPARVGRDMEEALRASQAIKVMVDHHPNPEAFCNITINFPAECSTSQMVYRLAIKLGITSISKNAATCLYTGIMTDTGSFRFASTTAITHTVIGALINCGANNSAIHEAVYDTNSENRLRLTGYALTQKLVVLPQFKTTYISLTKEELAKFNHQKGDTEGLVNYGLSIEGIRLAAIFMEKDDQIKISFRSKGNVPANELMSKNFSGGGHFNAAGGRTTEKLDVTIKRFLSLIPEFMQKYG